MATCKDCLHQCYTEELADVEQICNFFLDKTKYKPVRHGRWVKQWCDNNMIGHEYAECSVCGCSMLDTNQFWNSKYCPNCGAKMDGEQNG